MSPKFDSNPSCTAVEDPKNCPACCSALMVERTSPWSKSVYWREWAHIIPNTSCEKLQEDIRINGKIYPRVGKFDVRHELYYDY